MTGEFNFYIDIKKSCGGSIWINVTNEEQRKKRKIATVAIPAKRWRRR
jgi:hypothetical protein